MKLHHFIESQQLDQDTIFSLFQTAELFRNGHIDHLPGKILATLFYEPSTRTRLSFEAAMLKLGGSVITTENAKEFSSAVKGESIEDTIRVIAKYSDIIVMRHYEEGAAKRAADVSPIPIVNGGDGAGQHPTQALLDLYTIWKEIGRMSNITIAFVGDLKNGRTVRSLCYLLGKFTNIKIIFVAPSTLRIRDDIKQYLSKHNITFQEETNLEKVLPIADIVYMTRTQKERMTQDTLLIKHETYEITTDNLKLIRPHSRLLHPLPHVEEIKLSIETERDDPRIAYFRQAENGLYIRMALMHHLLPHA